MSSIEQHGTRYGIGHILFSFLLIAKDVLLVGPFFVVTWLGWLNLRQLFVIVLFCKILDWWLSRERRDHERNSGLNPHTGWSRGWAFWRWNPDSRADLYGPALFFAALALIAVYFLGGA